MNIFFVDLDWEGEGAVYLYFLIFFTVFPAITFKIARLLANKKSKQEKQKKKTKGHELT